MSAKAKYDRLHLLQRCDGDRSKGDPHPGILVLQRSRRLDHEQSPFTEEVETATVWALRTLTDRSKFFPALPFAQIVRPRHIDYSKSGEAFCSLRALLSRSSAD